MIDANVTFTIECDSCDKTIDEMESNILCNECHQSSLNVSMITLLDILTEKCAYILDGDGIIGFDSEKEKENFLRGARYGYSQAFFNICYEDDSFIKTYEDFREKFYAMKINTAYCQATEDKYNKESEK